MTLQSLADDAVEAALLVVAVAAVLAAWWVEPWRCLGMAVTAVVVLRGQQDSWSRERTALALARARWLGRKAARKAAAEGGDDPWAS